MPDELAELVVPDAPGWRRWLAENHGTAPGVLLVLAKKGFVQPTRLVYGDALEEALCFGWVDGRVGRRDEATYLQRFTPRRRRSSWSKNNVATVERLIAAGRMQPAGQAEVDKARADGRWDAAYAGSASIAVPADLQAALDRAPAAAAAFSMLSRQDRFSVLYRLQAAKQVTTRARKLDQYIAMLSRGGTVHPR